MDLSPSITRFQRLLAEAHCSLTAVAEGEVLVVQAGAHRVVLAPWLKAGSACETGVSQLHWLKFNECEYSVPVLAHQADLLLLLPIRAPLSLRVEEIRAQAQLVITAIDDTAMVQIFQYLDRFQTQSISELRRIFISCGLVDLWELSAQLYD